LTTEYLDGYIAVYSEQCKVIVYSTKICA